MILIPELKQSFHFSLEGVLPASRTLRASPLLTFKGQR